MSRHNYYGGNINVCLIDEDGKCLFRLMGEKKLLGNFLPDIMSHNHKSLEIFSYF